MRAWSGIYAAPHRANPLLEHESDLRKILCFICKYHHPSTIRIPSRDPGLHLLGRPVSMPTISPHDIGRPVLIGQLPNELLIEVFRSVTEIDDDYLVRQSEFRNIILVCQHFHILATPFLYASYEANSQDTHRLLLRSLLQAPHLTSYIHTVFHEFSDYPRNSIGSEPMDQILQYVNELRLPESAAHWPDGLLEGVNDYGIAVILCLATGVEGIEIRETEYPYDRYSLASLKVRRRTMAPVWLVPIVCAALGESFGRVHSFEKLAEINIRTEYIPMMHISALLILPSLRRLTLIGQCVEVMPTWTCLPKTSEVESLTLSPNICVPVFSALVNSCKALRELHWDRIASYRFHPKRFPVHWLAPIIPALMAHADTLNILDHIWHIVHGYGAAHLQTFKPLRDLHAVAQLTYDNYHPDWNEFRLDHIPRNIKVLTLPTTDHSLLAPISLLDELFPRLFDFPHLIKIEIVVELADLKEPIDTCALELHENLFHNCTPHHPLVEIITRKVKLQESLVRIGANPYYELPR
ncbi:hypothetical protein P154DRAFT_579621 [Amniculicola lignicola CBS 123094]|uniref:Uncharacterized protein n=1 Tax=Amniculicola lignicola CBS 123094 TaxID=1392246 RepID=A0A6A5WGB0_9PLEO|nr:hypothetical protein P154DRAFT_579621 [Amniculicola lignicola CBS 123094]